MVMKVYLAGPLFTKPEWSFNAELDIALTPEFDCATPQYFCEHITDPRVIAAKCLQELQESDAVVVNCDGADVESGTSFEAGYAYAREIPLIGYRTDFRKGSDNDVWPINLMIGSHLNSFIEEPVFDKLVARIEHALRRTEIQLVGRRATAIIATWPKWKRDFAKQWVGYEHD